MPAATLSDRPALCGTVTKVLCAALVFSLGLALLRPAVAIAQEGPIPVALVGALSGPFELVGQSLTDGAEAALARINQSGGVLGRPLRLITADDHCKPDSAEQVARDLVAQGVAVVIGHLCSGASIAASEIYAEAGIVQISPASTAPAYTERGLPTVFRVIGRDDMQGFVLADHIERTYRAGSVGLLHDSSFYSQGLAESFVQAAATLGLPAPKRWTLEDDSLAFDPVIAALRDEQISVLVFPGYGHQVVALLQALQVWGHDLKIIGSDTLMNSDFISAAGMLADGVELSFPPDPSHDLRNQALTEALQQEGRQIDAFTFYTFGALEVWAKAVDQAGSLDSARVAQALKVGAFDSVLGRISFDDKGDIEQTGFVMYHFIDGDVDYYQ